MSTQVLISGKLHSYALETLQKNTSLNIVYKPDCSREELERLIPEAHVLISRSETDVDRSLLMLGKNLKIVARAAVGVGNIDLETATERGILVINTPGKNTNSAAELTLGLLLAMLRKIPEAHTTMKKGGWDRHRFTGYELRDKRIGIIGLGNVGHRVARFCRGFDMEVYAYDPYIAPEVFQRHGAILCKSLPELLSQVDVVSFHVPLNKETKGMLTKELIYKMPRGSYVVNAARGGVFAEKDLVAALNDGQLAGAAIDTFESEPNPTPTLIAHEKVYLTPHIGASTEEAQLAIARTVVEQVEKILDGGVADYPVNLPELKVIDKPVLKAYAVLGEKLGAMAGQIVDFNPREVRMHYRGDIANIDHAIIRLSWMKGYASSVSDDYISFVNVVSHFEKMGLRVSESHDPDSVGYKSALRVDIIGADGDHLSLGGVVFDDTYPRITQINEFHFELEPRGMLILVENKDRPGVVGNLGGFLAKHQVNISTFTLSRDEKGGKAMALVGIDNEIQPADINKLKGMEHIENVRFFRL